MHPAIKATRVLGVRRPRNPTVVQQIPRSVTPGGIDAVGMGWNRATASPRGPTYLVCGRCSYAHGPIAARQSPDDGHQADHLPFKDLGKLHRRETRQNGQTRRLMPLFRAPLRNRTVDLLLTIYPRPDAVANWDDAGQVRGGPLCCRPTYLFIESGAVIAASTSAVTLCRRAHDRGCHRRLRS
jgi:hypothetical protein